MSVNVSLLPADQALDELVERQRRLYDGAEVDGRLSSIIHDFPSSKLSDWDILRILRASRSVFFDTHVEVVSGHHTATYLRFDSIARIPQLVTVIARDMADWVFHLAQEREITGIVATASGAAALTERVAEILHQTMRLRVALTPYDGDTGKIGTTIATGGIRTGERFLVLNDVTTRGNCVGKLSKVVTDHGGTVAGMMVFARRDSGQFPFVNELASTYPFYYTADLTMPQWEPAQCPLCKEKKPLLRWKDIPEL
jgi:orotate phosphoribosyltransferase